ncbi:MAG TPA: hypothetical protein VN734_08910 [Acidobacteriaceae bacterium]|nr:hypothetical protein [Acidobacteriaceae bacterium]
MPPFTAADKTRIALIVAFATILAGHTAKAQAPNNGVVANIPFAFQIGSYYLPAGTYRVQMQGDDFLSIKGDSGMAVMLVTWESASKPSTDSAIVFHHYENQYFLREIRTEGSQGFLWSGETKAERRAKLEEDASAPNSDPREDSKVEIALLTPPR